MSNRIDEKGIVYVEQPRVPTISLAISIFSLFLISMGALSIFALQKPVAETQSTVSQASVKDGVVIVSGNQAPNPLATNQLNTVDLNVNTHGIQTKGVTAVFNIVTDTVDGINVETLASAHLKSTSQEVQKTTNGFLIKVVAVPNGTAPFSSTEAIPFLRITFNPYKTGQFNIAFDQVYSHVYRNNSDEEELAIVPQMNYNITGTNPAVVAVVEQRSCNQECSNNKQCKAGLTCFDNRCRNPQNPDSTTCAATTTVTYSNIVKACNVACSSNKQCEVNLRCYNGACRLATNTSSTTCSPATVPVISSTYPSPTPYIAPTPTPSPTPNLVGQKGEVITVSDSTVSGSIKPTASPFVWPSPSPVVLVTPAPTPAYTTEVTPVAEPSSNPFTSFLDAIRNQGGMGLSFPLIAVIAGVALLIIALLLLLSRRGKKPTAMPPAAPRPASNEEQTLQQRIDELKNKPVEPVAQGTHMNRPAPAVMNPTPVAGMPPRSADLAVPPSSLRLQDTPVPAVPPSSEDSSSMMQRLKNKGIAPPMPNPTEPDQKK